MVIVYASGLFSLPKNIFRCEEGLFPFRRGIWQSSPGKQNTRNERNETNNKQQTTINKQQTTTNKQQTTTNNNKQQRNNKKQSETTSNNSNKHQQTTTNNNKQQQTTRNNYHRDLHQGQIGAWAVVVFGTNFGFWVSLCWAGLVAGVVLVALLFLRHMLQNPGWGDSIACLPVLVFLFVVCFEAHLRCWSCFHWLLLNFVQFALDLR